MSRAAVIIAVVVCYQIALLAIGWWATRRNHDNTDYYLGGRKLGPVVASLSAATSSSSAWSLLGVSGAAFAWGVQAIWLIPAVLTGFIINWFLIAPRMHRASHANQAVTLMEFISIDAASSEQTRNRLIRQMAALIVLFCFAFYIAAQFEGAGNTFAQFLPISPALAIVIGASVVMLYVFLGGFWAASVTDALQGVVMFAVALLLPITALLAVGGIAPLLQGLADIGEPGLLAVVDQPTRWLSIVFIAGLFGIGLGYPGQPHVVNRFMALEHEADIPRARWISIVWALVIFSGMVLLGLCARVLIGDLDNPENALFAISDVLLPSLLAGIVIAAALSAIMSTADSQLLTAASAVSHDLQQQSMQRARLVVLALGMIAVLLAIYSPRSIFERVLFAWQALGSAFGPILVVMLWLGPIKANWKLAAMLAGFLGTVALSFQPSAPGDAAERLLPLFAALMLALIGHYRQKKLSKSTLVSTR